MVYGPSANRKLRELQETADGKLSSDIGYPAKEGYSDWLSYSKSVMDATIRNGNMIHFDLTYMDDIENILNNTGNYANTVTAGELRYIRDNWSRFDGSVKFYNNGEEVLPPWMK